MVRKTNEQSEWKTEVERAERKQRLANLKDSEGKKKKITSKSIGGRIVAIAIAALLFFAAAVWAIARFGVLQRNLTAITLTSSEVPGASLTLSPAELNIGFGDMAMQYLSGYAFSDELQEELGHSVTDTGRTIRDELVDLTLEQMKPTYAMVLAMNNDESFVLSEEKLAEIDETIAGFQKDMALGAQEQGVGVGVLLSTYFGPGVSSQQYMKFIRQSMLLQEYSQHLEDTTEVGAAEIESYKEENAADLKIYEYTSYSFYFPTEDDDEELTEEELEEVKEKLTEDANAALELYKTGEMSFAEAMAQYETDENKKDILMEDPESLDSLVMGDRLSASLKTWLSDEERKAGDTTVVESLNSVTVLVFHAADFEDYNVYNVRHILINETAVAAKGEEAAGDEVVEALAEEILAVFEAGAGTEETFAVLAAEHSSDAGSAENGGLYENVPYGAMVTAFQDWCIDESREAGDTGIVKSDYGYHIMYFVGFGDTKSIDYRVETLAKTEKLNDWTANLVSGTQIERHSPGMGFVGRNSFFQSLFAGKAEPAVTEASDE